jgi:hypothetical protein
MQLAQWGYSRMETKRLLTPVTPPVRSRNGELKFEPGTFPFPRGLYDAVLRPDKLKTKKIQLFYNGMSYGDRELFEWRFVPIKYATLNRQDRQFIQRRMKKLHVKSFDRAIVEQRLTTYDLWDPYLVYEAIHMDGSKNNPRAKKWLEFYTKYRGIKCADVKNAKHIKCMEDTANVMHSIKEHVQNMIKLHAYRAKKKIQAPGRKTNT